MAGLIADSGIPLALRTAHEIPKPKDWQVFQRGCVFLFREELRDPNAQEYGRNGQDQGGIDVLGRRNGNPEHYVGVQARLINKPLTKQKMLLDCRSALKLQAKLKEIIFATTAVDDKNTTDAAVDIEALLRKEGHDITIAVYGWSALQNLIALHEVAYTFFFPSVVGTSSPQPAAKTDLNDTFAALVAAKVGEHLQQLGVIQPPPEESGSTPEWSSEDPVLHAKIDTFRDLFREKQEPHLAEEGLLKLLANQSLGEKPWARYRIETNLGSIALDLGREGEAAERFEAAHSAKPSNPNALANLALARTIQRRFAEAMELSQQALNTLPRADHAVAYLMQAAARSSDWTGNPETLIPEDLRDSPQADFGIAEFYRYRNLDGWAERSLALARKHPGMEEFKRTAAIAVLSLAIGTGSSFPFGQGPVSAQEIEAAADDLKAIAEHHLDIGYTEEHDLICYLNNAAMLLRLTGRNSDCEALLIRGLTRVPGEPQLCRLLALSQAAQGRVGDGLEALAGQIDPENRLLAAEMAASDNATDALAKVLDIDPSSLDLRLQQLRLRLAGELALKIDDHGAIQDAIAGLISIDPDDLVGAILQARLDRKTGTDEAIIHSRLKALASTILPSTDMASRYTMAVELRDIGLPGEAASLLEDHVDLERPGLGTTLYLQSLAEARRDDKFRSSLKNSGPSVRSDPEILWTAAAHSWNIGDLKSALKSVSDLVEQQPENASARLMKIEILIREDQSSDLIAELDKPIEQLEIRVLKDRFRIATLLGHFGYLERAASIAYKLYLENRDTSQAWMTFSTIVLVEGRNDADATPLWNAEAVGDDVAIDLTFDDGQQLFLIVEPDPKLRRLDAESWEPAHPLAKLLDGLREGDTFKDVAGRSGKVTKLRHKYVARLHFIMEHYEERFPEISGFRRISIDVERPGGLDEMIAQLKSRHDWVHEEQEKYQAGPWPIAILAHRLGHDTIEVANGLGAQGIKLKVAIGNLVERQAAVDSINKNRRDGCVLDLLAFWTAWRLQALEAVSATCGPIHVPQSVLDRLHARREQMQLSGRDGLMSAHYENGKLAMTEASPETVKAWMADLELALEWLSSNATVCPLVATDEFPPALRDFLRRGRNDIFDSLLLALQRNIILISDDLPTREFGRRFGLHKSAWLHQVFGTAQDRGNISADDLVRWSASLITAGHHYLGVTGPTLALAARMDAELASQPPHLFPTLASTIGGSGAEPNSHIAAVVICLSEWWSDPSTTAYRMPATGMLLDQLISERPNDYKAILRATCKFVANNNQLSEYIFRWTRGHFLPSDTLRV